MGGKGCGFVLHSGLRSPLKVIEWMDIGQCSQTAPQMASYCIDFFHPADNGPLGEPMNNGVGSLLMGPYRRSMLVFVYGSAKLEIEWGECKTRLGRGCCLQSARTRHASVCMCVCTHVLT